MSFKLYNPSVHLFAFYLQDNFNYPNDFDFDFDLNVDNQDWLWNECNHILGKFIEKKFNLQNFLDLDQNFHSPYTYLLKSPDKIDAKDNVYLKNDKLYFDKIGNFVCPVRIYDSYGLGLNLHHPENNKINPIKISDIKLLNPENCLILEDSDRFLGQTILITAHLKEQDKNINPELLKDLADKCITALLTEEPKLPPFNQAGKLFGSPIFEYGIFRQLTTYRHVLVWFFDDKEAENKFNTCYKELLDLFFFRAQVVNAYQRSCNYATKLANNKYKEIERQITKLLGVGNNTRLTEAELKQFNEQLQTLLQMALQYADKLRDVEDNQNKIVVHSRNYHEKLQEIKSIFPNNNIELLASFSEKTSRYFQEQVTAEISYFHHGFGLIDKAIASIRGKVAIETAERQRDRREMLQNIEQKEKERDRHLQKLIFAVGSGIGAAGIASSSYNLVKPQPDQNFQHPLFPPFVNPFYTLSIIYSLVFGVLVGMLIWKAPQIWNSFQKSQQSDGNDKK